MNKHYNTVYYYISDVFFSFFVTSLYADVFSISSNSILFLIYTAHAGSLPPARYTAMMAQWLARRARNHKVPVSRPATAMSSLGDWFTQP
jgi:hypothetical protein